MRNTKLLKCSCKCGNLQVARDLENFEEEEVMKKIIAAIVFSAAVFGVQSANADDTLRSALAGGLGGVAGTAIGQSVGGRNGGLVGAALGGAAGGEVAGGKRAAIGGALGAGAGAYVGGQSNGRNGQLVGAGLGGAVGSGIGGNMNNRARNNGYANNNRGRGGDSYEQDRGWHRGHRHHHHHHGD
jgi:hypothetical protein